METAKQFLNNKAKEHAYIDFYNFLVRAGTDRKTVLITKWLDEYAMQVKNNVDLHNVVSSEAECEHEWIERCRQAVEYIECFKCGEKYWK